MEEEITTNPNSNSEKNTPEKKQFQAVSEFIDKRIYRGQLQYKVLWKDQPASEACWEYLVDLRDCEDMIQAYEVKSYLKKHNSDNLPKLISYRKDKLTNHNQYPLEIFAVSKEPKGFYCKEKPGIDSNFVYISRDTALKYRSEEVLLFLRNI